MTEDGKAVVFRRLSTPETKARLRSIISKRLTIAAIPESCESVFEEPPVERTSKWNHSDTATTTNKSRLVRSLSNIENPTFAVRDSRPLKRSVSFEEISRRVDDADESARGNRSDFRISKLIVAFITIFILILLAFILHISYNEIQRTSVLTDERNTYKVEELVSDLHGKVYGQSIAIRRISNELKDLERQQPLPYILVLRLIGPTGTGKTFVTRILSRHFSQLGANVYWHISSQLSTNWLISRVWFGSTNIFILDDYEFDDVAERVDNFKNSLQSLYPDILRSTKFVFIVSSNQWASDIIDVTVKAHIEQVLLAEEHFTFLASVSTLEDKVKHVYVLFLPLTKNDVALCVQQIIDSVDNQTLYDNDYITAVLNSLSYFPPENPIFAKLGCKKLPLHVL